MKLLVSTVVDAVFVSSPQFYQCHQKVNSLSSLAGMFFFTLLAH